MCVCVGWVRGGIGEDVENEREWSNFLQPQPHHSTSDFTLFYLVSNYWNVMLFMFIISSYLLFVEDPLPPPVQKANGYFFLHIFIFLFCLSFIYYLFH